jgi:N-acetylglucosamine-6-sulfatase
MMRRAPAFTNDDLALTQDEGRAMREGSVMRKCTAAAVAIASLVVLIPAPPARAAQPDVIVILTDDQRWDTLSTMPVVQRLLEAHGVTFEEAYVPTALCCPSRVSLLTGRYAHGHGVWTNDEFPIFQDTDTVATRLDAVGYQTGYFGKYLNRYDGSRIPPGWDRWFAMSNETVGGAYFDYDVSDDGTSKHYGNDPSDYSTDVIADAAEAFVLDATPSEPLLAVVAPYAPHKPAIPAPRHFGALDGIAKWRPPSLNEKDVSDKPKWVRRQKFVSRARIDASRQRQLETLLAVDELVGRVIDAMHAGGRLDSALIVFTSDNAVGWGEHRLLGKNTPYEAASHIPLVVRWGGVLPDGVRDDRLIAANIDLTATVLEAAGADASGIDGVSLSDPPRTSVTIEAVSGLVPNVGKRPGYCGARTPGRLYVRYKSGFEELYIYSDDPWELENAASQRPRLLRRMRDLAKSLCGGLVP